MISPDDVVAGTPAPPPPTCQTGCNCGYLQYEGLLSYFAEINDSLAQSPENAVQLEYKLREQIIEISRLFDMDAGVEPGYFSKSHYSTTQIVSSDRTRYLKVPEHVAGTLEVRTMSDQIVPETAYVYKNGFLIFHPYLLFKHVLLLLTSSAMFK